MGPIIVLVAVAGLVRPAVGLADAYYLEVCSVGCTTRWGRTGPYRLRAGDIGTSTLIYTLGELSHCRTPPTVSLVSVSDVSDGDVVVDPCD